MNVRKEMNPRKLLIATVGLATASYLGCRGTETSGNLVPPPSGNLVPPPDAGLDLKADKPPADPPTGNLVPPPPDDASAEVGDGPTDQAKDSAGDGADANDAGHDTAKDTWPDLPPVGNLIPPPDANVR